MTRMCPECKKWNPFADVKDVAHGTATTWIAPDGLDPKMRQFECPKGHQFYMLVGYKAEEAGQGTLFDDTPYVVEKKRKRARMGAD